MSNLEDLWQLDICLTDCLRTITVWQPLCDSHCVSTLVWQPLCNDHCVTTTVWWPLCDNHCVMTTNFRPLCYNHCVTRRLSSEIQKYGPLGKLEAVWGCKSDTQPKNIITKLFVILNVDFFFHFLGKGGWGKTLATAWARMILRNMHFWL